MVQSFANLRRVDVGFRTDGLLTANTALPPARYDRERRAIFYDRVVSELQGVAGVESAGFVSTLPFLSRGNTAAYRIEGISTGANEAGDVRFRVTTNEYLKTLGARLVEGRLPGSRDAAGTPPVVVVNESFANRHFPRGDALGHRLAAGANDAPWMTIIGVVADIRENGYEVAQKPGIYVLASQLGFPADNLVVRTAGNPLVLAPAVRAIVSRVDPEQPVAALRTMDDIVAVETVGRRQQSIILTAFALTALLLASIGIYGLVSFSVTVRRREVGLRTALGGSVGDVTRSLVRHGLILVAVGLATGLVAALAGTRIMEGVLFGIAPQDPPTFVAIAVLVLAISSLACWLPAWRAARMSPMTALRQE
jgi:putative ABC transport system permease protein